MKRNGLFVAVIFAFLAMAFTAGTTEYKVDAKQSKVVWLGKKVTGEHTGGINIADGKLISDGKNFTGGSFTIDMASMTCTDVADPAYNEKFIGHLKSDDFFSTAKFPKSNFVITKITSTGKDQYNVKGKLTIKGITNEIEFPATIQTVGKQIKANAKIVVNRTKYDIKYGSGSFFDNLGDKAINDDFELNVDLVAAK
ncbi:YceI family protein [Sporocytophaga myxococcoides]|uniref:YceI family protein n=1 Tax=Sporocytophaga myxococcoides TaxID=153721 RepID=A0A098LG07_9BACT|nr:YceI family protein [Sporocytophaga myxococcoides]GAL85905.1 YceI family protein [Sporocytophaga myxococcoides]